jgi:hypothetical protein
MNDDEVALWSTVLGMTELFCHHPVIATYIFEIRV